MEQGFTIAADVRQRQVENLSYGLTVELGLGGDLRAAVNAGGDGLTLTGPDGTTSLDYSGLSASDATGRVLPASLEVCSVGGKQELLIHVNDAGAKGPITIDPFVQEATLTASDGAAADIFGYSVAVSGNTVVVGAPHTTLNGNTYQGEAYVFVEPSSGWSGNLNQTAKLTASDGAEDDDFGMKVAIDGDTVVVGAKGATVDGNADQGEAYVFVEPSSGVWPTTMTQTAKLTASDGAADACFGTSVAVSGDTVVVGAWLATVGGNAQQGAAYVFEPISGVWTQTAKLTASDGAAGDGFGWSAAIDGDTLVVGADEAGNSGPGAAYVFVEPSSGWSGNLTETAKLTASDGAAGDVFGSSVAISGGTVVVGAGDAAVGGTAYLGAAYVFVEPSSGWSGNLTQAAKLTASDGAYEDFFGNLSAAISGDTVVVGAQGAGEAYVFVEPSSGWSGNLTETSKLTASGGAAGSEFGFSAAIDGDTLVVGAQATNSAQGAAYVFVNTPVLSPPTLPVGTENVAYSQTITASGGTGTVTLTVSNIQGTISGLTVPTVTTSATGSQMVSVSGTPTATGTETFTVTATDSLGTTTSTNYSLTVQAITLNPATLPADTLKGA